MGDHHGRDVAVGTSGDVQGISALGMVTEGSVSKRVIDEGYLGPKQAIGHTLVADVLSVPHIVFPLTSVTSVTVKVGYDDRLGA